MSKHEIDFVLTGQHFKIDEIMKALDELLHDEGLNGFAQEAILRAHGRLSEANVLIELIRR